SVLWPAWRPDRAATRPDLCCRNTRPCRGAFVLPTRGSSSGRRRVRAGTPLPCAGHHDRLPNNKLDLDRTVPDHGNPAVVSQADERVVQQLDLSLRGYPVGAILLGQHGTRPTLRASAV